MIKNITLGRTLCKSQKQIKLYRNKEEVKTHSQNHLYSKNQLPTKIKTVEFIQ